MRRDRSTVRLAWLSSDVRTTFPRVVAGRSASHTFAKRICHCSEFYDRPTLTRRQRTARQGARAPHAGRRRGGNDRRDRGLHRRRRSGLPRGAGADAPERAALRTAGPRLRLPELRHPLPRERGHGGRRTSGGGPDSRAGAGRRHSADGEAAGSRAARQTIDDRRPVPRPGQPHARPRHHARPTTCVDLVSSRLVIEDRGLAPASVSWGPRIGITVGVEKPWRCWITGHPAVSRSESFGRRSNVRLVRTVRPVTPIQDATMNRRTSERERLERSERERLERSRTTRTTRTIRTNNGTDTSQESVGSPHGPAAADRADAALHRPAPRARGDEPAGVRRAAAARLEGGPPRSHVRHGRSHRPDAGAEAPVSRRDRRGHDRVARANCRDFGVRLAGPGRRPAGDRPRDRSGARAHAAGDDDRLRRQPHLHAWRVRLGGVRHRHLAGARRARVAVPGAGAAQGAAHPRDRATCSPASTPRTSSSKSSSASASAAAPATPTSTPATPSIA